MPLVLSRSPVLQVPSVTVYLLFSQGQQGPQGGQGPQGQTGSKVMRSIRKMSGSSSTLWTIPVLFYRSPPLLYILSLSLFKIRKMSFISS